MFSFFGMAGNYETRKVARNDYSWGMVDTCAVNDGAKPFETAVQHKAYSADMVIVENYDTKEEAKEGHAKWVKAMTAKKLPTTLKDCNNSKISQMGVAFGGNYDRKKQVSNKKRKSK